MTPKVKSLLGELKTKSSTERKKVNEWFFKTGKGQYGEGDVFIGVTVPDTRVIAKKYYNELNLTEVQKVLSSKIHEERLVALEMLCMKYDKTDVVKEKTIIYNFYLKNKKYVNNWDLVDLSAEYIIGDYLFNYKKKDIAILKKLAKSKNIWDRRISILSCFYFIKQGSYKEFFEVGKVVDYTSHDLLQKAFGWMLREIYKRIDKTVVEKYLKENISDIPRTTLRYAIEKMDKEYRKYWLALK